MLSRVTKNSNPLICQTLIFTDFFYVFMKIKYKTLYFNIRI